MTIWKFASRWDNHGDYDSSILDIFWKHSVVFISMNDHDLAGIHPPDGNDNEDLITIADGYTIVGIAKPLGYATPFLDLGIHLSRIDLERLGNIEQIVGVKVKIFTLSPNHQFTYRARGRFHNVNAPEIVNRIYNLWENLNEQEALEFEISANTKTLNTLLSESELYIIPVYQRPYAWGSQEIERFVTDIIRSISKNEIMFIGTIQLSEQRLLSPRGEGTYSQEVIDGQQRLTTCALILKALLEIDPDDEVPMIQRDFNWLESRVSNGEQQRLFDEAVHNEINEESANGLNPYIDNCYQIMQILESYRNNAIEGADNVEEDEWVFNTRIFIEHLTTKLQFVVIETTAGLSKTLQIFNTINTAGLELNGEDLFKIRSYEYLKDYHGQPEACFTDISDLYELIDKKNRERTRKVSSIDEILGIYQAIVIGRSPLPTVLTRFGTETFYERLFDARFGIRQWDNYGAVTWLDNGDSGPLIRLNDIQSLINMRYNWEDNFKDPHSIVIDDEARASYHIIQWTRYSAYWSLGFVFHFKYADHPNVEIRSNEFIQALGKLFIVYSILYARQVYEIHGFVASLIQDVFQSPPMMTMESAIERVESKTRDNSDVFYQALRGPFAGNRVKKNLLCRILEWKATENILEWGQLERLFGDGYDIEHIQSYNDSNIVRRDEIWEEWGDSINGLGNLMLLESEINRSIKNANFDEKREAYNERSNLAVARIVSEREVWGTTEAEEKLDGDIDIITNYVFERND